MFVSGTLQARRIEKEKDVLMAVASLVRAIRVDGEFGRCSLTVISHPNYTQVTTLLLTVREREKERWVLSRSVYVYYADNSGLYCKSSTRYGC